MAFEFLEDRRMIAWRALLILAVVASMPVMAQRPDAQDTNGSKPDGDDAFRIFHLPNGFRSAINTFDSGFSDPFGPPEENRFVAAGHLAPLFERHLVKNLSKELKGITGIEIADGWALHSEHLPLLFVRAAPSEIEKLEEALEPDSWVDALSNRWCRAVVVADAIDTSAAADDAEAILDQGTVLADLILFTTWKSEIRLGSLADETDTGDEPEAWGTRFSLAAPAREGTEEEFAVSLSLRRPPNGNGDRPAYRLDWEDTFPPEVAGEDLIVPVNFAGDAGTGFLILRFDVIPAYAWDEPISQLVQRKEQEWQKVGPDFEPEFVSEFGGVVPDVPARFGVSEDADWMRRYNVVDPVTNSAYFETVVPPTILTGRRYRTVSAAGFQDVFPGGDLLDVQELFEAYGITFRPGDLAVYNPEHSKIYTRTAPDQVMLIDAVFCNIQAVTEKMIQLRTAILEAPADGSNIMARPPISSLKHSRVIDSRSVIARSGQRIRIEAGSKSSLKVDPVLGPYNRALDVGLNLDSRGGRLDHSILLQGVIHREQTALIQLGSLPDSPGSVCRIALRADVLNSTGEPLRPDYLDPSEGLQATSEKEPTTLWEKRGPQFKLVPPRPVPTPIVPPDPLGRPDPFSNPEP